MSYAVKYLVKSYPSPLRNMPPGEEHCPLVTLILGNYPVAWIFLLLLVRLKEYSPLKMFHGENENLETSALHLNLEASSYQLSVTYWRRNYCCLLTYHGQGYPTVWDTSAFRKTTLTSQIIEIIFWVFQEDTVVWSQFENREMGISTIKELKINGSYFGQPQRYCSFHFRSP